MKQLSLILSVFLFISLTNNVFGQANSGGPRSGANTTTTTTNSGKNGKTDKKGNAPKRDIPFTHSLQAQIDYGTGVFPGMNFNTISPGVFTAQFGYRSNLISTSIGFSHFTGDQNPTFIPDTTRSFATNFNSGFVSFEVNVEEAIAYLLGKPGRRIGKFDGRLIMGTKMQFNQRTELYRGPVDQFELRAYTGFTLRYRFDDLRQARAALFMTVKGGYRYGSDGGPTRTSYRLHALHPDKHDLEITSHSWFVKIKVGIRYLWYPWR